MPSKHTTPFPDGTLGSRLVEENTLLRALIVELVEVATDHISEDLMRRIRAHVTLPERKPADERVLLTVEQAVAMLPEEGRIHTFRSAPGMLLGADWDRDALIKAITEAKVRELSGEGATAMHHGLVIDEGGSPLFIETQQS